jgi:hypothetical protein
VGPLDGGLRDLVPELGLAVEAHEGRRLHHRLALHTCVRRQGVGASVTVPQPTAD